MQWIPNALAAARAGKTHVYLIVKYLVDMQ